MDKLFVFYKVKMNKTKSLNVLIHARMKIHKITILLILIISFSSSSLINGDSSSNTSPIKNDEQRLSNTVLAVSDVMPSVVNIATKTRVQRVGYLYDWWRDNWTPYAQDLPPQESAGSGVIISQMGHVLTNVHVVRDADEIWVKITDKDGDQQLYQAEAIAGSLTTDIAILKIIPKKEGELFPAAFFAKEGDLLLGETVIALGNPFGLGGSVSKGILSSKSRRIADIGEKLEIPDWLQTDASINPGNSGGPLINLNGDIIGINVAVLKEGQGIGFAIPIKRVNQSLSRLFTPEFLDDNWFGAAISTDERPPKIIKIESGSPADKAGLKKGDELIALNGIRTKTFIDFSSNLVGLGENRDIMIEFNRNMQSKKVKVRLIPEKAIFNSGLIRQKTGAIFKTLTSELADALNYDSTNGFVISQIDKDSPAQKAGLIPGLIITSINGEKFNNIVDFARLLYAKETGDEINLEIVQLRQRGLFVRRSTGKLSLKLL